MSECQVSECQVSECQVSGVEPSFQRETETSDSAPAPVAPWSVGWRAMLLALLTVLAGVGLLIALAWGYKATATRVTVTVDDMTASVFTHQAAVSDLLSEMELKLAPEDHLVPAASAPLTPGLAIAIQRARPVLVHVDGRSHTVLTHATTVGSVLSEAGVAVGQHDPISLASAPATLETALPKVDIIRRRNFPGLPGVYPWRGARLDPLLIDLQRAVPLRVRIRGADGQGDQEQPTIWSTSTTVGEALDQDGLVIYEGDLVQPPLGEPLVAGLVVTIERSKPVELSTATS